MSGNSLPRLGDYLLIERIGEGGMAEVFRAQYSGDEHSVGPMSVVVVKRIKPELFNKPEFPIFREMFLNEAKLVRSLQHPNLARVYALMEAVDPALQKKVPFIVQEYVRGYQLWELLRIATRGFTGLGIPAGIAAFIAREMARGLGHAHSHKDSVTGKLQPIIHRDISPENVMVSAEGSIKVIDFGVAKALGGFGPQTRTGIIKGKLAYMAPEQVAQKVVPATDVFGVGIVLHEMLTGRRLFGGHNDFIVISRVLKAEIPRPSQLIPSIPKELDDVVMTALSRDLKTRYVDGNALADALTRAMAKLPAIKGTTETTVKQWSKQVIAEGQKISSNWNEEESGVHVDVDVADAMRRVEGSGDDIIELTADDLMRTDVDGAIDPGVRAAVTQGLKTLRPDMLAKSASRASLAPVSAAAVFGGAPPSSPGPAPARRRRPDPRRRGCARARRRPRGRGAGRGRWSRRRLQLRPARPRAAASGGSARQRAPCRPQSHRRRHPARRWPHPAPLAARVPPAVTPPPPIPVLGVRPAAARPHPAGRPPANRPRRTPATEVGALPPPPPPRSPSRRQMRSCPLPQARRRSQIRSPATPPSSTSRSTSGSRSSPPSPSWRWS